MQTMLLAPFVQDEDLFYSVVKSRYEIADEKKLKPPFCVTILLACSWHHDIAVFSLRICLCIVVELVWGDMRDSLFLRCERSPPPSSPKKAGCGNLSSNALCVWKSS